MPPRVPATTAAISRHPFRPASLLTAVAVVSAMTADRAVGAPVGSDGFTYGVTPPVALNGQNGGSGFTGAWAANSTTFPTNVVDPPTDLVFNVTGGGTINGGNRAVQFAATGANVVDDAARRVLSTTQTGDVWVSWLIRGTQMNTAAASGTGHFISFFFQDGTGAPGVNTAQFGLNINAGGGGTDFFSRIGGTNSFAGNVANDATFLVVGHFFKSAGGNYDRLELWVNPEFDDELAPLVVTSGGSGIAQVTDIGFRAARTGNSPTAIWVDELRIGTTWADVVPVPEPATAGGLGLAVAGLVVAMRRRAKAN